MAGAVAATGLASEARIARAAGFATVTSGGDAGQLARLLGGIGGGATCLVSFGIAGGLQPGLAAGTVVLSGTVIAEDQRRWVTDPALHRQLGLLAGELGAVVAPVLGAARIIATADEKARLGALSQAAAVDLESAAVAEYAAVAGIPFVVLRAIADTVGRDLPPAALLPLRADGRPQLGPVLRSVAAQPQQIAALIALALATRRALTALVGPAEAIGRLVL